MLNDLRGRNGKEPIDEDAYFVEVDEDQDADTDEPVVSYA